MTNSFTSIHLKCRIFFAVLPLFILSCTHARKSILSNEKNQYDVGHITFDESLDDPNFRLCDSLNIFEYYNTDSHFKDNKDKISHYFLQHFSPAPDAPKQSGYITVKFIINCNGVTGRFRVFQMDSSYRSFTFDKRVSDQLLNLTKGLKGWKPAFYEGKVYDSYQYITFRLRNGNIISISP
jgi:hypothetical protein